MKGTHLAVLELQKVPIVLVSSHESGHDAVFRPLDEDRATDL